MPGLSINQNLFLSVPLHSGMQALITQELKGRNQNSQKQKDEFGVWHVCYSIHSSREELDWALKLLQPKWVISTTPPCRAMELDYVKKHCFKTQLTPDDPLWKLLKVCTGKYASLPPPPTIVSKNDSMSASLPLQENTKCASLVGVSTYAECNLPKSNSLCANHLAECNPPESNSICTNHLLKLDLSSPSTAQPITLFGRVRLGLPDHDVLQHEKSVFSISDKEAESLPLQKDIAAREPSPLQNSSFLDKFPPAVHELSLQDNADAEPASFLLMDNNAKQVAHKQEEVVDVKRNGLGMESLNCSSIVEAGAPELEDANSRKDMTYLGSSRSYNTSLRRLYMSMKVPVPRPLPSLVQLMDSSKRIKVSSEPSYSALNYCSKYYL